MGFTKKYNFYDVLKVILSIACTLLLILLVFISIPYYASNPELQTSTSLLGMLPLCFGGIFLGYSVYLKHKKGAVYDDKKKFNSFAEYLKAIGKNFGIYRWQGLILAESFGFLYFGIPLLFGTTTIIFYYSGFRSRKNSK